MEQYIRSNFVANIHLFKEIADLPLPNNCSTQIQGVDWKTLKKMAAFCDVKS